MLGAILFLGIWSIVYLIFWMSWMSWMATSAKWALVMTIICGLAGIATSIKIFINKSNLKKLPGVKNQKKGFKLSQ